MKRKFILLLVSLTISFTAGAHRLNEYLEATTVRLSRDKISLTLRLTPGVDIAGALLKGIDLNGDERVSSAEGDAYVSELANDLSLTVDGRNRALLVVSSSFPTTEAIRKGTGDIVIVYETDLDTTLSAHQLQLKNNHHRPIAAYLINCLVPGDTAIQVDAQTRNADQSFYQLDFRTGSFHRASAADSEQVSQGNLNDQPVVKTYFLHGIRHILTGYDHLLFLCALVLGASGLWDLIKIVTAFTIAHSITLTLATFGLAHLPEHLVEPIIAASIVFVALQNVWWPKTAKGKTRLAVAFAFGLFHGLGFAGGLLAILHSMPTKTIWYAILGFSLGVEAGNQLVLLPFFTLLHGFRSYRSSSHPTVSQKNVLRFQQFASGAVAIAGIYYLCIALAG